MGFIAESLSATIRYEIRDQSTGYEVRTNSIQSIGKFIEYFNKYPMMGYKGEKFLIFKQVYDYKLNDP